MKAVILAAGRGSRISAMSKGAPKPLLRLLGLSLIERVILSARESGISEFIIITGFQGEKIREELGSGEKYNVKITYIENEEWDRGNAISLLKAREVVDEPFLLFMCDHIFEPSVVDLLRNKFYGSREDRCLLVIDTSPPRYIDVEEATKVKTHGDRIVDIGKNLEDYDGVDCGLFLLTPTVFDAIEKSLKKGDDSLSGGIRVLSSKDLMGYVDIGGRFWIDIDTIEDYRRAEREMLRRLTKPTDGPVSRYLNRRFSTYISKYLVRTRVTPNVMTIISFLITLPAVYLFLTGGDYLHVALAGLITQFSSIVDGVDGEIARLKYQRTSYGAWLDSCLDRYSDALIIFSMMYGWWLYYESKDIVLILGFTALIGSFMNSYTSIRYDEFIEKRKIRMFHIGRDVRLLVIMIGALLKQIPVTLLVLAIFTNAEAIRRLVAIWFLQCFHKTQKS